MTMPRFAAHDCGEGFRATHDRFARITRAHENRIVALDRGGKTTSSASLASLRAMLLVKTQTEPLQSIRLHGADFVGAADLVSELESKARRDRSCRFRPRQQDESGDAPASIAAILPDAIEHCILQRRAS